MFPISRRVLLRRNATRDPEHARVGARVENTSCRAVRARMQDNKTAGERERKGERRTTSVGGGGKELEGEREDERKI